MGPFRNDCIDCDSAYAIFMSKAQDNPDNQWLQLRQSSAAVATRRAAHHRGRPATRERSANAITVLKQKKSVLASEVKTSTLVSSPTVSGSGIQRRDNERPSSSSPPPPSPPAEKATAR